MYRPLAHLEKYVRNGNVTEAIDCVQEIIDKSFPCKISLSENNSSEYNVIVNVFNSVLKKPIKLNLNIFLDDTFLTLKRKVCGELSGVSPYQQKLIICTGSMHDLVYKYPSNCDKLKKYFSSQADFEYSPICVYVTEACPHIEFKEDGPVPAPVNWACKKCTFVNDNVYVNCAVCGHAN